MMRKSRVILIIVITGLMFYTGCDDGGSEGGVRGGGGMAPAPVPQTGQMTCWDEVGAVIDCATDGRGQDGDIRAGVEWPVPRFTDNGEGQITDNLTGLVWLKDMDCSRGGRSWQQALDFANGLEDGQCGLTDGSQAGDWRLPNRNELRSLLDFQNSNPALPAGTPFTNFRNDLYWTSTSYALTPEAAWSTDMRDGASFGTGPKRIAAEVVTAVRNPRFTREAVAPVLVTGQTLCYNTRGTVINCAGTGQDGDIRAGVPFVVFRFTRNGDGTVTDKLTGLIWLENADCFGERTWQGSLVLANTLKSGVCGLTDGSVAGDWRLPNVNELTSLLNMQQEPAIDTGAPLPGRNLSYWTSTTYVPSPSTAWRVQLIDGGVLQTSKNNNLFVTAVRDPF